MIECEEAVLRYAEVLAAFYVNKIKYTLLRGRKYKKGRGFPPDCKACYRDVLGF